MDFNTIKVAFPHDQEGKYGGRLTHYAEFIETRTERILPHDEDFLGLFINLGKALDYELEGKPSTIGRYQYNLIYVPKHGCKITFSIPGCPSTTPWNTSKSSQEK
jgi:hypothetical protein